MDYWGRVWNRAWHETLGEVRLDTPVRVLIAVGSPLAAGGAVWATTGQPAWGAFASFGLLVLIAVGTLGWKLLAVPATLDAEHGALADKRATRETLGAFLGEAQELMRLCVNEDQAPPDDAADHWAHKCEARLRDDLDESYVHRFRSGAGLPLTANSIGSIPHRNLWGGLHVRAARLQEFIRELV